MTVVHSFYFLKNRSIPYYVPEKVLKKQADLWASLKNNSITGMWQFKVQTCARDLCKHIYIM